MPNGDCVDAVVELNGERFAIEVIGHKYTQETINNKVSNGNMIAGNTILLPAKQVKEWTFGPLFLVSLLCYRNKYSTFCSGVQGDRRGFFE